jgi:chemotaxis protein methyltransferase CheR
MTSRQALDNPEREFHFTDQDFQKIRKLIYDHAGISLSEAKKAMVYSRVARRLRATRLTRFDEYLQLLETHDETEWEAFVNVFNRFFSGAISFSIISRPFKTAEVSAATKTVVFCRVNRRRAL